MAPFSPSTLAESSSFLNISPLLLAQQWTLLDHLVLSQISLDELRAGQWVTAVRRDDCCLVSTAAGA